MTHSPFWKKLYDDTWGVKLDHSCAKPGDVVTVPRRDGTSSDETLKKCLSEGPSWSLWRVLAPGEILGPPPKTHAQARRPLIRRAGSLLRLPVLVPEPPPHTDADADAPPPGDEPGDE